MEQRGAAWTDPGSIETNGPFILKAWQRGASLVLVRNPHYHGRLTGNVQRVDLSLYKTKEWLPRLESYEADLSDWLELVLATPPEMDRIRRMHAGEYVSPPSAAAFYLAFDVRSAPFDDPRVRQALAHAVDREAVADVTLGGYQFPATGGFVPATLHSPVWRIAVRSNSRITRS